MQATFGRLARDAVESRRAERGMVNGIGIGLLLWWIVYEIVRAL